MVCIFAKSQAEVRNLPEMIFTPDFRDTGGKAGGIAEFAASPSANASVAPLHAMQFGRMLLDGVTEMT